LPRRGQKLAGRRAERTAMFWSSGWGPHPIIPAVAEGGPVVERIGCYWPVAELGGGD